MAKTTAHKRTILNIKKQVEVDLELSILVKNLNSISWPSPFKKTIVLKKEDCITLNFSSLTVILRDFSFSASRLRSVSILPAKKEQKSKAMNLAAVLHFFQAYSSFFLQSLQCFNLLFSTWIQYTCRITSCNFNFCLNCRTYLSACFLSVLGLLFSSWAQLCSLYAHRNTPFFIFLKIRGEPRNYKLTCLDIKYTY